MTLTLSVSRRAAALAVERRQRLCRLVCGVLLLSRSTIVGRLTATWSRFLPSAAARRHLGAVRSTRHVTGYDVTRTGSGRVCGAGSVRRCRGTLISASIVHCSMLTVVNSVPRRGRDPFPRIFTRRVRSAPSCRLVADRRRLCCPYRRSRARCRLIPARTGRP